MTGLIVDNFISESGLFTLILRHRDATTPGTAAHRFRKWVTSEVLPAIRKTGQYQLPKLSTQKAETVEQPVPAIYANFPKEVQSIFMLVNAAEASCKKGGAK